MYVRDLAPLGAPGICQFTLAEHVSKLPKDYKYSQLPHLPHDSSNHTVLKCGSVVHTFTLPAGGCIYIHITDSTFYIKLGFHLKKGS